MGMLSEFAHGSTAKELEKILYNAIKGDDWSDVRSAAKGFARKELYDWYLMECSDAYITPDPTIIKEFGK